MKLKLFNRKSIIIFLSLVCLAVSCVGLFSLKTASADVSIYYDSIYVRDAYTINEEFEIPKAFLKEGNAYYDAVGVLTFPSGKTVVNKTVLDEAGEYNLEYRSLVDGEILTSAKTFNVYETLYSVSGFRSSAAYGVSELVPSKKGIVVSLAQGDKLLLNTTIDLNKVDKLNKLISFFVIPEEEGKNDVAKVHITFTDVYDSSNYVTITGKRYESQSQRFHEETQLYVVAGAKNQVPVGVIKSTGGEAYYNGDYYYIRKSDSNKQYGTDFKFALKGEPYSKYGDDEFSVSWDYANRVVYGCDTTTVGLKMITDLDASEFFEDLWDGFTTGEVIMSVHASNYSSSKFNFVITELYGEDVSENVYVDQEKPVLNLDLGEYTADQIPNAIVGKPYSIFPASAIDAVSGNVLVKTNVYYNYGSSGRVNVTIENGQFIPQQSRDYTIVYEAVDYAGNVAKEVLTVKAIENSYAMSLDFEQGYATTGFAGQKIKLATPNVNSLLDYKTKVQVTCDGQDYQVTEDGYFTPMGAGTYNVSFRAESYVESAQNSYDITVSASDQPIFLREAYVPKYFVKNATYNLDVPEAVQFSNGKAVNTTVSLFYGNDGASANNKADANSFTVSATNSVTLKYQVSHKGKTAELVYDVPVVGTGHGGDILLYHRYFAGENITATQADLGVSVVTAQNDNYVEFVNRLALSEISLDMTLTEKSVGFSGLDYYFTNVLNDNATIKVSLKEAEGKTEFSVNDGRAFIIDYVWGSASNPSVTLLVNFEKATVTFASRTVSFDTDCYGNPYVSNGKYGVDIKMVMNNVTEESGFEINGICTQVFKKLVRKDIIGPTIIAETKKGSFAKGATVTISPATATDILDPFSTCSMYVITPSGKFVKTVDGVTLKEGSSADRYYDIKLTEDGSYMVYYVAEDGNGNVSGFSYSLNVVDMTPPKLTVNTDTVYATLGESITIKNYTASDETSKVEVLITLTDLYASVKEIEPNSKLVLDKVGEYTITYYAYDETDNFTILSYKIVVTESEGGVV